MAKVGNVSAFSGRNITSISHSVGEATKGSLTVGELTRCRACNCSSELRATVSSGFSRPLTRTGSLLKPTMSKADSFFAGRSDLAAKPTAITKARSGRSFFMLQEEPPAEGGEVQGSVNADF